MAQPNPASMPHSFVPGSPQAPKHVLQCQVPDTIQPCDTTQVRSYSDFDVKSTTVQVYGNSHNSLPDRWIGLIFYIHSPDMFSYPGLKIQVNQSLGRHRNTGQQRLYEFCYLLSFDLWTSYLVSILFLQGYCSQF